ncbi:MAG: hypothetical protein KGK08_13525 [Acidobacteriota bacterium]|nr:hypothetical protein [Acidobacteriota bacterium]
MVQECTLLSVWIPEQMKPGTMFLLREEAEFGSVENPYAAVLACPSCGCLGYVTLAQMLGYESTICGSACCSAEFFLENGSIRSRRPA